MTNTLRERAERAVEVRLQGVISPALLETACREIADAVLKVMGADLSPSLVGEPTAFSWQESYGKTGEEYTKWCQKLTFSCPPDGPHVRNVVPLFTSPSWKQDGVHTQVPASDQQAQKTSLVGEEMELSERTLQNLSRSLASMITEYVEGGIASNQNWRNGLDHIISARLQRLWPLRDTVRFGDLPPEDREAIALFRSLLSSPTSEGLPEPSDPAQPAVSAHNSNPKGAE